MSHCVSFRLTGVGNGRDRGTMKTRDAETRGHGDAGTRGQSSDAEKVSHCVSSCLAGANGDKGRGDTATRRRGDRGAPRKCLIVSHVVSRCLGVGQRTEHGRYSVFKESLTGPQRRVRRDHEDTGRGDTGTRRRGDTRTRGHADGLKPGLRTWSLYYTGVCCVFSALKTLHGRDGIGGSVGLADG